MKTFSLILFAGLLTVTACSKKDEGQSAQQSKAQVETQQAEGPQNNLALHSHDESLQLSADRLYACPMDAEYITSDPDTRCTHCEMPLKPIEEVKTDKDIASVKLYSCSMHPEYVTSDPNDQCPICEMKVAPVE